MMLATSLKSLVSVEVLVDKKEQNWFKRTHVGKFLGLVHIHRSTAKLADKDHKTRAFLKVEVGGCLDAIPPREDDQEDHHIFILLTGALYVVVNYQKDKRKALKKQILKDIVPRRFDVKIELILEKHQQAIDDKDVTTTLLNDDLENREYENLGLHGEIREKDQQIAALQRRYVSYLSDEGKNNGISIITKNNEEAQYPYNLYAGSMVIEGIRLGCC